MRLDVEGLSVRFGTTPALAAVDCAFPPGSSTVIWGPAGCGKTTLLKCLAGLVRPTAGRVTWDGKDVAGLSPQARRDAQVALGMVFQSDALFDSLTVLDNVLLPLRKRGVAEPEARERAEATLAQVGLSAARLKFPEQLSGGMKKRVGVARAIVARPQVLLADDPFAGLDPDTEAAIAAQLLEVSRGRTLVVALPDPLDALPVQRTLRLVDGHLALRPEAA